MDDGGHSVEFELAPQIPRWLPAPDSPVLARRRSGDLAGRSDGSGSWRGRPGAGRNSSQGANLEVPKRHQTAMILQGNGGGRLEAETREMI